jgi:hypothetical protein
MNIRSKIAVTIVAAFAAAACGSAGAPGTSGDPSGRATSAADLAVSVGGDAGCAGVGTVFCINGGHWDPTLCECVPPADAACVDNVLCIQGDHWDSTLCRCVPDGATCKKAADCKGPLPQYCLVCSDGTAACAHWACVNHQCEIATCQ